MAEANCCARRWSLSQGVNNKRDWAGYGGNEDLARFPECGRIVLVHGASRLQQLQPAACRCTAAGACLSA